MKAKQGLMITLSIIPLMRNIVRTVENYDSMDGAAKKEAALTILGDIWAGVAASAGIKEIKDVPFEAIKPIADPLIDTVVSAFNLFGIFKTSKK